MASGSKPGTSPTVLKPPTPRSRLFGRIIVTIALVGGLVGGLVALMAGKEQAMDRKARLMAPAPAGELNAGGAGTDTSTAPPAPAAGSPAAPP